MNDSNFHYAEEQTPADPQRQQLERRAFDISVELNAADIMKIIALIGGIVIAVVLIVCAHSAGMMVGVLFIVGMVAFIALIGKIVD